VIEPIELSEELKVLEIANKDKPIFRYTKSIEALGSKLINVVKKM
jgi:hypothetical protein